MSCRLSRSTIDGMPAIHLENDLLSVGVLPGRGSDIFEFRHKAKDIDFLLRLRKGIRNPQALFSQIRNTRTQFEDYYYGGWQVCLPNSPPFNYRGAELGQHGEISLIPWEVEVLEDSGTRVSIRCVVEPLRIPIRMERTLSLEKDSLTLVVEETVQNYSATVLDVMWGQHIAFGLPFMEEGVTIKTNAKTMDTEGSLPDSHFFRRGEVYGWPLAKTKDGKPVDAEKIPAKGSGEYSDLCYLEGYSEKAYYTIKNEVRNIGLAVTWDGRLFKSLWLWQERNSTKNFPWWGDCYTAALEPWTSKWTNEPQKAIENNEWFRINAGERVSTIVTATAFESDFNPKS